MDKKYNVYKRNEPKNWKNRKKINNEINHKPIFESWGYDKLLITSNIWL